MSLSGRVESEGGWRGASHCLLLEGDEFLAEAVLYHSKRAPCSHFGLTAFPSLLIGNKVILRTDHYSLKWLKTFKVQERIMARWIETLYGIRKSNKLAS